MRLRRDDIKGRDAIRVQLYLKNYGLPVWDVKTALLNEYRRYSKSLLRQIRSTYADNKKLIPAKRKASLLREVGRLDERFVVAGIVFPSDIYIETLRAAKQDHINLDAFRSHPYTPHITINKLVMALMSGFLLIDGAAGDRSAAIDSIDNLIEQASDSTYEKARTSFDLLLRYGFYNSIGIISQNSDPHDRDRAHAYPLRSGRAAEC